MSDVKRFASTVALRQQLRERIQRLLQEITRMQVDIIDGSSSANEALVVKKQYRVRMLGYRLAMHQIFADSDPGGLVRCSSHLNS